LSRPVFTVVAGSNGCGKSTLTSWARGKVQTFPILDPDAIARTLQDLTAGANSDLEAGKRVLRVAEEFISRRESFTVETTLSGSTYLRMAARARSAGFNVILFLVITESVEINLLRVRARVAKGGHDVPEEDQRRRFPRTRANMRKLLPLADFAIILDNSSDQGHVLVGVGHAGLMHWVEPVPDWAEFLKNTQ